MVCLTTCLFTVLYSLKIYHQSFGLTNSCCLLYVGSMAFFSPSTGNTAFRYGLGKYHLPGEESVMLPSRGNYGHTGIQCILLPARKYPAVLPLFGRNVD